MKKYIRRYATGLALAASLVALSPVTHVKNVTYCGVTISVNFLLKSSCEAAITSAIATCSVPADGGGACAGSVTAVVLFCGTGVYEIMEACFD